MTESFDYSYNFGDMAESDGLIAVFLIIYLIYILVMMGLSIAQYVLYSLGMYTIAKRRGIQHPWLSWLPIGNTWVLGCISDQYQYVVKGKVKNKRKALLVLNILNSCVGVIFFVCYLVLIAAFADAVDGAAPEMAVVPVMLFLLLSLAVVGLSVAQTVIMYIALYDLYTSCEPKNNILYLVLSIFFSITMPLFVFLCRKKDLGMPPRRPQPAQEAWVPVEPPEEPWEKQ